MQNVKLNLIPGSVLPVVNVSQYDAHRQFSLSVYEGATAYDLTGKTVEIRGTKPDGNGFAYDQADGVVSVSGNTVTISTKEQMTAVGGQTMAELRITSGTTILGTLNFVLDVEPSALSDDTPISGTEIPAIERQLEEIVESLEVSAEDAEAWAVGERDGEPVPSSDPTYHNNAKYYASNALSSASTATTKAGEAATSATNAGNSATTASNAATTATTKAGEASTSATNAGNSATAAAADSLEAEGWAVGEQGGQPVGPTSPYFHNNAKYYSEQTDVTSLASMSDVDLTSPSNNQVLKYDAATQKWVNGTGGGGADALDDLTDVTLTSPAEGDLLQYDATGQKWVNSAVIPQKVAGLQATGCVNILPNDGVSSVIQGVTFTANADKSVTLNGGPASGSIFYDLYGTSADFNDFDFAGLEKMILSGGSELSSNVQLCLDSKDSQGSTLAQVSATGVGVEFTKGDRKKIHAWIYVRNGTTVNNVTVYPMIYPAGFGLDVPYVPQSMTNRELTEEVIDLSQRGRFDGFSGAGFHNSLYRGNALGGAVSTEQWAAISAGTFDDLFIGDYWTIGGINYRIAAFDYWLHCGDTECTTHHVVLVPDTNLYTAKMNDTNITTGGYIGSKMCTDNLASAKTTINTAFGSAHILRHEELLVNATASGSASGCTWFASTVELMSESMVYGHHAWAANTSASGLGYETGIDKGQLPLFALEPSRICNRANWWLRDVVSSTFFALVGSYGNANRNNAGNFDGVRPVFGIIG